MEAARGAGLQSAGARIDSLRLAAESAGNAVVRPGQADFTGILGGMADDLATRSFDGLGHLRVLGNDGILPLERAVVPHGLCDRPGSALRVGGYSARSANSETPRSTTVAAPGGSRPYHGPPGLLLLRRLERVGK